MATEKLSEITQTTPVAGGEVYGIQGGSRARFLVEEISQIGASSVTTGITAFAGGGQGSAVELTTTLNEISTVATTADSVKLDAAVAAYSKRRTLINKGANACDVFPASGDDLGAGVDTAVSLAAGANITYESYDATNWVAVS